jgi:hypothetical protein
MGGGSLSAFGTVGGRRLEQVMHFHVVSRKVLGDDLMTVLAPRKL